VDFDSKDQMQNNKFHRWPVNFSTIYDFSARNLNMTLADKDLKEKENKRKRKRGKTVRGERNSPQQRERTWKR